MIDCRALLAVLAVLRRRDELGRNHNRSRLRGGPRDCGFAYRCERGACSSRSHICRLDEVLRRRQGFRGTRGGVVIRFERIGRIHQRRRRVDGVVRHGQRISREK